MSLRLAMLAASIAALLMTSGCTFDFDEEAQPVDDAPPELLEPSTSVTSPGEADDESFTMTLMFINSSDRRVPVQRPTTTRPTIQAVLDGLAQAPGAEEQASPDNPIRTALFSTLAYRDVGIVDGVLNVMVGSDELRSALAEQPERVGLIYGQIVCSVTAMENATAERVAILDGNGMIDAPTASAATSNVAVGPADYQDCATAEQLTAIEAEAGSTDTTADSDG